MSRVRGENDLGQYMTPPEIARSMLQMFTRPLSEMKLLDPACGDGNLLAVAAEEMKRGGVTDIAHRLVGFDVDGSMLAKTRDKLRGILGESARDVRLSNLDFLSLGPFHPAYPEGINAVLSNPPYGGLREYKFFEKCLQLFARGTEMVFLMPLAFVDRAKGIKAKILEGRPLGVTTGHAIVYHVNGNPVRIAGTGGRQQNSSGFRVLTGVKLYQLGEGDPPQNERIVKEKPFSSTTPRPGWLPCLRTGDVHPFRVTPGRLYVRYGPHLAHPKEIERFVGPKVFVRRVPIWRSRTLGAAYCEDTLLCAGDVLVVRHEHDDRELLRGLERFLNSLEVAEAIYQARPSVRYRDSYPKVSAKDLNLVLESLLPSEAVLRAMGQSDGKPTAEAGLVNPRAETPVSAEVLQHPTRGHPGSLIVQQFPVAELSTSAQKEKSTRKGHISTLQMWWARRPLGVTRAAIFAALCPTPASFDSSPELVRILQRAIPGDRTSSDKLTDFVSRLASSDVESQNGVLDPAVQLIAWGRAAPPVVVDTFAGGGSIPVEALRLGLDAKAGELNPVAAAGLRVAVELAPGLDPKWLRLMEERTRQVDERLNKAVRNLYDHEDGVPLAYFWCRTYVCPSCSLHVPLLRNKWLANRRRNVAVRTHIDPDSHRVRFAVVKPETTEDRSAANRGTVSYKRAECPRCSKAVSTTWLQAQGKSQMLSEQLYALLVATPAGDRLYVEASDRDEDIARCSDLRPIRGRLLDRVPDVAMDPNGVRHVWAYQYGVTSTADLYNRRQGVALLELFHELMKLQVGFEGDNAPPRVKRLFSNVLALMFNRVVMYSTRHTWWQSNGEFPANMFSRQAIPMVWNYLEVPLNSPGAAGWKSAREWVLEAVSRLTEIKRSGEVWVGDAAHCPLESGIADLVAIDPPYYDSIAYGYLSDVFYVWMKHLLGELYPNEFQEALTPKSEEAIVDRPHRLAPSPKSDEHFRGKLSQALQEAKRVLKPDGLLMVMYGHKRIEAWVALIESLLTAAFTPLISWPVHTERKVKFRHGRVAASSSSCIMVCRPARPMPRKKIGTAEFNNRLEAHLGALAESYSRATVFGRDLTTSLLVPACSVFAKYRVVDSSNHELSLKELLSTLPDRISRLELELVTTKLLSSPHEKVRGDLVTTIRHSYPHGLKTKLGRSWMDLPVADNAVRLAIDVAHLLKTGDTEGADALLHGASRTVVEDALLFTRAFGLCSEGDETARSLAEAVLGRVGSYLRRDTTGRLAVELDARSLAMTPPSIEDASGAEL